MPSVKMLLPNGMMQRLSYYLLDNRVKYTDQLNAGSDRSKE